MLHFIGFILEIVIEFGVCALAAYLTWKGFVALSRVEIDTKDDDK